MGKPEECKQGRHVTLAAAQPSARALLQSAKRLLAGVLRRPARPGDIAFGDLRRVTPISRYFGYDRGTPLDRYYIDAFLGRFADDVRGRVLEIGEDYYAKRYGGANVTRTDVLDVRSGAPGLTILDDLSEGGDRVPSDAFDCIILTQTLHYLFDVKRALATLHRALKPNGVLLLTTPGIASVGMEGVDDPWYWSLTSAALERLLEKDFGRDNTAVFTFGNVLSAAAFLYGLAGAELTAQEIDAVDPRYPVIVAARTVKAVGGRHAISH